MKWHYVIQVLTEDNEIQNVMQACNNSLFKSILAQPRKHSVWPPEPFCHKMVGSGQYTQD